MAISLLIGSLALAVNMSILVLALVAGFRVFIRRVASGDFEPGFGTDVATLAVVLGVLYLGHLLQFATWALLFLWLGEFGDFQTAFYHSTVNFTSLGYGDIVMSPQWRLLGGLEAMNGVLMFGLSAGVILSIMNRIFGRHAERFRAKIEQQG